MDAARGDVSRPVWAHSVITRALDRTVPPPGETPEQAMRRLFMPAVNRGGYVTPLEDSEYPKISELMKVVPVAFPPPVHRRGGKRGVFDAGYSSDRFFAERCIWMGWMENTGWPWEAIASEMGYDTPRNARRALNRYTDMYGEKIAEARRGEARVRIGQIREVLEEEIINPGYLYDVKGDVIRDPDGGYALDRGHRVRAVDTWVKLESRQAANDGSDAAVAARTAIDNVDYSLRVRELVAEVLEADAPLALESGDQEAGSEGDEPGGLSPAEAAGVPEGGDEPHREEDDGGDQEDQPET